MRLNKNECKLLWSILSEVAPSRFDNPFYKEMYKDLLNKLREEF